MPDLSTTYMGLSLKNPIVPSASPLSREFANLKKMEDAGAAAVVLYSLFEEQVEREAQFIDHMIEDVKYRYAEMIDLFPDIDEYRRDEDEYLNLIRRAKEALSIPVIPSLNGFSTGGWTEYARLFEEAGADAIELNIYYIPTSINVTGSQVEDLYLSILTEVKEQVSVPVALKLSPYFSATANAARRFSEAGADGLVLFNRFYQPDLDVENLEAVRRLTLSTPAEIRLPLRWIAILYGRIEASLALTTGVHAPEDVVKAIMAGADVANICSVLLKEGIGKVDDLVTGLSLWMEQHGYESVTQMKGVLSHKRSPDPAAFERANYVKLIGQDVFSF
ncbi:MAG: dihydroorotate dehydrogenase-like protein [Anaerolineae bacterium]